MGSALSRGGGLTESQMKRAKAMNLEPGEFKQMLLNKMRIEGENLKKEGRSMQRTTSKKKRKGAVIDETMTARISSAQ